MIIDFAPVKSGEQKILEYSAQFTVEDLRSVTNASINYLLDLIAGLSDADVTFDPADPEANDPHAVAGEEHIGWSLAHLVAHVTATCEEWAAYSSVLARGIVYPAEPRLRYETPWREVKTHAQCVQRLEESRRIRLAFLNSWPNEPHLHILWRKKEKTWGLVNAVGYTLEGLKHDTAHLGQIAEIIRQAKEAEHELVSA